MKTSEFFLNATLTAALLFGRGPALPTTANPHDNSPNQKPVPALPGTFTPTVSLDFHEQITNQTASTELQKIGNELAINTELVPVIETQLQTEDLGTNILLEVVRGYRNVEGEEAVFDESASYGSPQFTSYSHEGQSGFIVQVPDGIVYLSQDPATCDFTRVRKVPIAENFAGSMTSFMGKAVVQSQSGELLIISPEGENATIARIGTRQDPVEQGGLFATADGIIAYDTFSFSYISHTDQEGWTSRRFLTPFHGPEQDRITFASENSELSGGFVIIMQQYNQVTGDRDLYQYDASFAVDGTFQVSLVRELPSRVDINGYWYSVGERLERGRLSPDGAHITVYYESDGFYLQINLKTGEMRYLLLDAAGRSSAESEEHTVPSDTDVGRPSGLGILIDEGVIAGSSGHMRAQLCETETESGQCISLGISDIYNLFGIHVLMLPDGSRVTAYLRAGGTYTDEDRMAPVFMVATPPPPPSETGTVFLPLIHK